MVLLSQNVAILENLRAAQSYAAQTQALSALKNETVGHVMKKEKWVELGLLPAIVEVLSPQRPANWHVDDQQGPSRTGNSHSRQPSSVTPPDNLLAGDLAHLQALELLGVFASGGASFLDPLHASGALPALLSYIDLNTTHPRLVYAALRAIVTITKAARLVSVPTSAPSAVTLDSLANTILTAPHLHALYTIIASAPRAWWAESITNAAVSLISPLCRESHHQVALAKAGILDALAIKVASFVVARGQVVPGADIFAEKEGLRDAIPEPATPRLDICAVLDAVAAIVGDSRLRACMLLSSPSILAIFPQLEFESPVSDIQAAWRALSMGGLSSFDQQALGALDFLLPAIPSQPPRTHLAAHNAAFPPLGASSRDHIPSLIRESSGHKHIAGSRQPQDVEGGTSAFSPEGYGEEPESPMVPWLISLVRSSSGLERLMAASVLTSLFKAGFASKTREAAMALLIVPLLLHMLEEAATSAGTYNDAGSSNFTPSGWEGGDSSESIEKQTITEAAITVLARLVANSDVLQKAAVDGGAIKILAKLLKEAYEPVSTRSSPRPWNPTPTNSANPSRTGTPVADSCGQASGRASSERFVEDGEQAAASKLGPAGQSSQLSYRIRLREATLKALTALVAVKYDYQKAFVEQDAMYYVVASLNATPSKPRNNKDRTKSIKEVMESDNNGADGFDPEYGRNPFGVLVAACNCVRMLSRSIAILRTTLEDAGVAAPIFRLLRHPDVDVQIAATGVICNLLTETSPMREGYAEAGVMNILCTHAHSLNSPLRLNALWALKHFVDGVEPSMKKACIEQLGSGWLMQLVDPDLENDASPSLFAGRDGSYGRSAGGMAAAVGTSSWSFTPAPDDEDVEMDQYGDDNEDDDESEKLSAQNNGKAPSWAGPTTAAAGLGSPSFQRARFPRTSHERSRTGRLRQAEAKLAALHEIELAALRKSQNDDVLIQEQGLNFIRNLIGPGSYSTGAGGGISGGLGQPVSATSRDAVREATEMIDYLFSEIGQDHMFQILLSKLKPKVRPTPSRVSPMMRRSAASSGAGNSAAGAPASASAASSGAAAPGSPSADSNAGAAVTRVQPPRAKIIEAVVFILVHISASVPRHRQVVISQTELLRALVSQFLSRDKGVRMALCHLVTNLTWQDDSADSQMAAARSMELKRLGLLTRLETMQYEDAELDVREQAKMAVHQMTPLN